MGHPHKFLHRSFKGDFICVLQIGTALWDVQSLIFALFSPPLLAGVDILIALK